MKITEWLNNQENYGMCNPPMDAQTAINFLADYLEISDNVMSESVQQTNTYYVCEILSRYSKKYKKEIKMIRWVINNERKKIKRTISKVKRRI